MTLGNRTPKLKLVLSLPDRRKSAYPETGGTDKITGIFRINITGVLSILALSLLPFVFCSGPEPGPNIILIVLDTTRADYINAHGERGSNTPFINEISDQSVVFTNAFAPAPWTLPSHVSLFTGLYPHQHGTVHENFNVDGSLNMIAEICRTHGYATVGVNCNPWLNKPSGIAQGFDIYEEISTKVEYVRDKGAELATSTAKQWMSHYVQEGKPFFLFMNYLDPHLPYAPPLRVLENTKVKFGQSEMTLDEYSVEDAEAIIAGTHKPADGELETARTLYTAEISYLDLKIEALVSHLRELGCLDETFLVITSDHGEHLGEHDLMGHEFAISESVLHVPLLIRYPPAFRGGLVIDTPVSLIDILPTVLELIGDDTPHPDLQGRSLFHLDDSTGTDERVILSELSRPTTLIHEYWKNKYPDVDLERFDRGLKAVRDGRFKYIVSTRGEESLFDLVDDPEELTNLADSLPVELEHFRSLVEEMH